MSYTLNSAKDASGQEQLYMEVFNRLSPQIQQYKQQHGGDLEGAFGAVTGTPWPSGRSVKISHGVPEMTKDRTIKSVLGKYVALPAAIGATAMFAPAALPAIAHAAGHAALQGGLTGLATRAGTGAIPGLLKGDWKSALTGAATGAVNPGGFGTGGSVMKNMLLKAGTGAVTGGLQNGIKGVATGAAGGVTSAIPGNVGKILSATGQSGVGGDIMSSIMNRGQNSGFTPGQPQSGGFQPPTNRPQGW